MADPDQIHQVVMNLCTNAAQAMPGGGVLSVELTGVDISRQDAGQPGLRPGRHLRLSVSDTGTGMTREVQERIFEPFFTTKPAGEGTGLGLAVVHSIVSAHGGTINVYSEHNRGTTFHVYLPTIGPLETARPGEEALPPPGGTERLLVVDDEVGLVEAIQQILTELGYEVEAATSPEAALETFRRRPHDFDLVITDQTMPHLTGLELAREMLALRPGLPIIVCTGFHARASADSVRLAGARRLLMKPLAMRELAEAVRQELDARAA